MQMKERRCMIPSLLLRLYLRHKFEYSRSIKSLSLKPRVRSSQTCPTSFKKTSVCIVEICFFIHHWPLSFCNSYKEVVREFSLLSHPLTSTKLFINSSENNFLERIVTILMLNSLHKPICVNHNFNLLPLLFEIVRETRHSNYYIRLFFNQHTVFCWHKQN